MYQKIYVVHIKALRLKFLGLQKNSIEIQEI